MAVRETNLWAWLKRGRKLFKKALHLIRIENSVLSGTPDVEGVFEGSQFWIELKVAEPQKTETSKITIKFRPAQIPWIQRRSEAGGRAFVLVQVGAGRTAERYLVPGRDVATLERPVLLAELCAISIVDPRSTPKAVLLAAARCPL